MKRFLVLSLLVLCVLPVASTVEAARRVRVVHRGHRTTVTVRSGFPIRRTLPHVYIRAPLVAVRVTPRVFLPPVVFGAVIVAASTAPDAGVWRDHAELDHDEGWTEFTLNVDRRGSRLLLGIDEGAAQISFAEVVFENGEAQVVDFADRSRAPGIYSLLDFKDGRKVDHVRLVAKADSDSTEISLHLLA